jgi:hypothetical protein
MPDITEEEMILFKELVSRENQRRKDELVKKELFLEELSSRTKALLDLNKSYGPVEAYAVTFAKFMNNDFKAHKCDELWFNWQEIQNYLTDVCLVRGYKGQLTPKPQFRNNLKDRGICMRIDREYNTVKIFKCEKRKSRRK